MSDDGMTRQQRRAAARLQKSPWKDIPSEREKKEIQLARMHLALARGERLVVTDDKGKQHILVNEAAYAKRQEQEKLKGMKDVNDTATASE
jgi:hypothetical protein